MAADVTAERCGGCPHAGHKNACRAKAPSGCVSVSGPEGNVTAMICFRGARPQCPCAWRVCKCGALVVLALLHTDRAVEVPVLRGSSRDPAGLLEVWGPRSPGLLWCRELQPGEPVAEGRWRGVEHDGPCQEIHGPDYQEAQ